MEHERGSKKIKRELGTRGGGEGSESKIFRTKAGAKKWETGTV